MRETSVNVHQKKQGGKRFAEHVDLYSLFSILFAATATTRARSRGARLVPGGCTHVQDA